LSRYDGSSFPFLRLALEDFFLRNSLLFSALGALVCASSGAQAPAANQNANPARSQNVAAQAPTLSLTTRLVVLDVVVTDKSGRTVPGLTQNDFTLLEDKQPQTIRSFEGPDEHKLPAGVEIHSTADLAQAPQAPITILVLDELNTRFEDMSYARDSLANYLKSQPTILGQPMTLQVASNTKFQVLRDYTQDRDALLTALKSHFPEYPWRLEHSGKGGPGAAERLAMSLGSLEQIAQASAGHPGRKNIIWVGRGFPAVNTNESTDKEAAVIQQAVQHAIGMMRDERITLTSIDPTEVSAGTVLIETPDDPDAAEDENGTDPFAGNVNFQLLAPATGGRIFASLNGVDAAIGTAVRDGDNYYTLSYSPTNRNDTAAPYRRIGVKMNRPGLTAATRNGYYTHASATAAPAENGDEELLRKKIAFDLGSAANSNIAYTGLSVTPRAASGALAVDVAAKDLALRALGNGVSQSEVTLMVAVFKGDKMVAHEIHELTARVQAGNSEEEKAEFGIHPAIPAGATRVRIIVRDAANGKMGTVDLSPALVAK
jgi:VWFA-related protein